MFEIVKPDRDESLKGLIYDTPDAIKFRKEAAEMKGLELEISNSDLSNIDIEQMSEYDIEEAIKKEKSEKEEEKDSNIEIKNSWHQMIVATNISMGNKNLYKPVYQTGRSEEQIDER